MEYSGKTAENQPPPRNRLSFCNFSNPIFVCGPRPNIRSLPGQRTCHAKHHRFINKAPKRAGCAANGAMFREGPSSSHLHIRKRAEYCFESTVSGTRTHWASLSFGANSVSSAKNSVSSRLHTNNRLKGTHWVRSLELSEPRKTHWVRCLKPYSPKPYSARFRHMVIRNELGSASLLKGHPFFVGSAHSRHSLPSLLFSWSTKGPPD